MALLVFSALLTEFFYLRIYYTYIGIALLFSILIALRFLRERLPRFLSSKLKTIVIICLVFASLILRFQVTTYQNEIVENKNYHVLLKIQKVFPGKMNYRIFGESQVIEADSNNYKGSLNLLCFIDISQNPSSLKENQTIWIEGQLKKIENKGGALAFNWKEYYKRQGIEYTLNNAKIISVEVESHDLGISFKIKSLRESLISKIDESDWSSSTAQVIKAMLLGEKSNMDSELRNAFATAGVIHVLAVSGLHVGIIYLFIRFICGLVGLTKKNGLIYVAIVLLAIWMFALITGLTSSVVRASFMFSLVVIAESIKRKSSIYNTIACSAFFILLFDHSRLFDLGFQLSYSAVLGIIAIYPILNRMIQFKNQFVQRIAQMMFVSIAAQIATLPLILFYFGKFPLYFLIGNLVAIPATSVIVVLALVYIISLILLGQHFLVDLQMKLLDFIVLLLQRFISAVSELPYSQQESQLDKFGLILCIAFIILLVTSFYNSSKKYWWLSFVFLTMLIAYNSVNQLVSARSNRLDLMCIDDKILISVLSNNKHELIKIKSEEYSGLEYDLNNYRKKEVIPTTYSEQILDEQNNHLVSIIAGNDKWRFLIVNKWNLRDVELLKQLEYKWQGIIVADYNNDSIEILTGKTDCYIYLKHQRNNRPLSVMKGTPFNQVKFVKNQEYVSLIN